jgi:hypothetical protein
MNLEHLEIGGKPNYFLTGINIEGIEMFSSLGFGMKDQNLIDNTV